MAVEAARRLRTAPSAFVGIGLPSLACNLARRAQAPNAVLVYDELTIGAKPTTRRSRSARRPRAGGDGGPSSRCRRCSRYWLQGERIDVGFLGAAQIDRFGNLTAP